MADENNTGDGRAWIGLALLLIILCILGLVALFNERCTSAPMRSAADVPFTASPTSCEASGECVYFQACVGEHGDWSVRVVGTVTQ
jgi:hypothetical protein